jgi:hypothetical protein
MTQPGKSTVVREVTGKGKERKERNSYVEAHDSLAPAPDCPADVRGLPGRLSHRSDPRRAREPRCPIEAGYLGSWWDEAG